MMSKILSVILQLKKYAELFNTFGGYFSSNGGWGGLDIACIPFGRAHPYALIPSKGLPSRVRA